MAPKEEPDESVVQCPECQGPDALWEGRRYVCPDCGNVFLTAKTEKRWRNRG